MSDKKQTKTPGEFGYQPNQNRGYQPVREPDKKPPNRGTSVQPAKKEK